MPVVELAFELVARELYLARVDDDDEIARVLVGGKGRLVLATQDACNLACEAAKRNARRVDDKPRARFLGALLRCYVGTLCQDLDFTAAEETDFGEGEAELTPPWCGVKRSIAETNSPADSCEQSV